MDETTARALLAGADSDAAAPDGGLYSADWYLGWTPGDHEAGLDGRFTADELEAIAWWMRNHG